MLDKLSDIKEEKYLDKLTGDCLILNLAGLKKEYNYIGLWYAVDRNEKTYITTEFYYSDEKECKKPYEFTTELKENNFKQIRRQKIPLEHSWAFIATRIEKHTYCRMKAFPMQSEELYLNSRVIRNRAKSIDTLKSGIIRGSNADFYKLGIEDGTGKIDYNDTIMFLVGIKDLPPADWNVDHRNYAIQRLPLITGKANFSVNDKYSEWNGQNPLEGV
jgi:hypothetical protein